LEEVVSILAQCEGMREEWLFFGCGFGVCHTMRSYLTFAQYATERTICDAHDRSVRRECAMSLSLFCLNLSFSPIRDIFDAIH
jgi:hypothetical protein